MKTLVSNYTFSAAQKRVTFTDYPTIKLDQILLITNVIDNIIIYSFADTTLGGTLSGNSLTLSYETTTMSDTDRLQIFIDDYIVPATEPTLQTVSSNITATNNALGSIQQYTEQMEAYTSSIVANTEFLTYGSGTLRTATNTVSSIPISSIAEIWSIEGFSYAGYDQYLQVITTEGDLLFSQKIESNKEFKFSFRQNGAGAIALPSGGSVRNSLTPFSQTQGNKDLYLFVRGKRVSPTPVLT